MRDWDINVCKEIIQLEKVTNFTKEKKSANGTKLLISNIYFKLVFMFNSELTFVNMNNVNTFTFLSDKNKNIHAIIARKSKQEACN